MQKDMRQVLSQVINLQSVILGPAVAVRIARKVGGFTVDDAGNVTAISGDGDQILEDLVQEYAYFSGEKTEEYVKAVLKKIVAAA